MRANTQAFMAEEIARREGNANPPSATSCLTFPRAEQHFPCRRGAASPHDDDWRLVPDGRSSRLKAL